MRGRLARILSLSTAISLLVALVLPAGPAFGSRPSAVRPSSRSVADTSIVRPADSALLVDPLAPSVPGELVVVLDSSAVATSAELALEARGAQVERPKGDPSSLLVKTPLSVGAPLFTQLAADTPGVAWVQPNYIYHATYVPNDPLYPQQWGLGSIAATGAWDVTKGSGAVVVAAVDTGVDYTHPDLVGRVDTANDYDFVNGDSDAMDDNDHGTHVAGIIAATMDNSIGITGVAPKCRILPIKVLSAAGWGDSAGVAAGIRYAADHGAKVINLSLAGSADAFMGAAVAYAQSKGAVVVAAAGNEGVADGADYPARYPNVIGVGAVDSRGARASFSNYGTGVDVAAPGVGILSTVPGDGYESWSGTSMASPFVSAVAALVIGAAPNLGASAVIARVTGAGRVTPLSSSLGLGTGIVNAAKAVGPPVPPVDSDVPGLLLGASPVSGTLAASSDRVYRVRLGKDQTLETSLTAVSGDLDPDLRLYGPGTTSITTGTTVAFSVGSGDPETIVYKAPATGWYYLDVRAYSGTGTYELTWAVTGVFDDDIPGVPLPASPVTGTVDRVTDRDDVYSIALAQDDLLVVELAGPLSGADMNLYLYGPGSTTVLADDPLTGSAGATSNEWFRFRVHRAGTYYVDVEAYSGAGSYRLTYSVTPGAVTDNIPGLEPTSSPVAGTIGGMTNPDDVYKVYLHSGQTLDLTLTTAPQPGTDSYPWLLLYPPTSTDVETDGYFRGSAAVAGVSHFSHEATSSGYYYIDLYSENLGDPVAYVLEWHATAAQNDNIRGVRAPASPIRDVLGATTDADNVYRIYAHAGQWIAASLTGVPATSTDFDLYLYSGDATDTRSATPLAKADGAQYPKAVGVRAPGTGYYYLQAHAFAGEGSYTLKWSVRSFATVYKPVAPASVTRGHQFTVYGYVAPRHTSGTYLVTLRFYQKNSLGAYVYHNSVRARRYSYSSTKSKYRASTSLPHRGVWRVRAVHSDTGLPDAYSPYDYISVR